MQNYRLWTAVFLASVFSLFPLVIHAQQLAIDTGKQYWISYHSTPDLKQFDKTQWQVLDAEKLLAKREKNFWLWLNFELAEEPLTPQGLYISLLGSYQVFWDGELIGANGTVGHSVESEKPGQIDYLVLLPTDKPQTGSHSLALKVSTYHNPEDLQIFPLFTFLSDYSYLSSVGYQRGGLPMMMAATLLLMAVYCFALYFFTGREASYMTFASLCLAIFLLIITESWRGLWGYSYDWQIPRLQLVLFLSCLVALLLTVFFANSFKLSPRLKGLLLTLCSGCQLAILLLLDGYDHRSLYVFLVGIGGSGLVCLYACYQRQKDAWLMCLGLLLFVAPIGINTYSYMDQYFFLSFYALILLMLYRLVQSMRLKQQQLLCSKVNASRLELELVKRNIQPHFILNTLTAIEEWIEDSPPTAVKFIQALADEFRTMAQISALPLVSLQQELQLCEAHLKVMGFRTNRQFHLQDFSCDLGAMLPPGVLLTLLENAISHNSYADGQVLFSLRQVADDKKMQSLTLHFEAPVIERNKGSTINAGIGFKYIQARLNESFQQRWELDSILSNDMWQVRIKLPYVTKPEGSESDETGNS